MAPHNSPSLQPSQNSSQIFIAMSNNQNCSNIDSKSIYIIQSLCLTNRQKNEPSKGSKTFFNVSPNCGARVKFRFIFVFKKTM